MARAAKADAVAGLEVCLSKKAFAYDVMRSHATVVVANNAALAVTEANELAPKAAAVWDCSPACDSVMEALKCSLKLCFSRHLKSAHVSRLTPELCHYLCSSVPSG